MPGNGREWTLQPTAIVAENRSASEKIPARLVAAARELQWAYDLHLSNKTLTPRLHFRRRSSTTLAASMERIKRHSRLALASSIGARRLG